MLRRLRIFGQRDKLKTDRSKRGVRSGYKEKAAQRGIQSAGGDGGAFRGEDPDGAVGGVWGSSDDGSRLLRACYGISAWVSTAWFAHDSPLEGDGFERSVPRHGKHCCRGLTYASR